MGLLTPLSYMSPRIYNWERPIAQLSAVAISRDGSVVVSGLVDGTVQRYRGDNGDPIGPSFKAHHHRVVSISIHSNGQHVVSCASDGTICVVPFDSRKPLKLYEKGISCICVSPCSPLVIAGGGEKGANLKTWDIDENLNVSPWIERVGGLGTDVTTLGVSNGGATLACGTVGGVVAVIFLTPPTTTPPIKRAILSQQEEGKPIISVAFTKDPSELAVISTLSITIYTIELSGLVQKAKKRIPASEAVLGFQLEADESCCMMCTRDDLQFFTWESGSQISLPRSHGLPDQTAHVAALTSHNDRFHYVTGLRGGVLKYGSVATIFRPSPYHGSQESLLVSPPSELTDMITRDSTPIGGGGHGDVYKGTWSNPSSLLISLPVAIKVLKKH